MQNDDIRNVWQAQGTGAAPFTLEELRKKGDRFRSRIAWRNRREYLGLVLVVGWFGYGAWAAPSLLMRVGDALVVAGALFVAFELHRRAAASTAPGELGLKSCVEFHRAQLVRQRDALRSVWKWYLGPVVPGLALIIANGCMAGFRHSALAGLLSFVPGGFVALVLWWVGRLNRKAADRIQRQIDALN